MHNIELNIEDLVLLEDVDEVYTLASWENYCLAQMNYCIETQDYKGVRHWILEHQRAVNDLKYLQFKKLDSERKMTIEKGN